MADVLGSRLGRYDIRERIGRGGMATVYKAWDMNLDRWVAVKVLHDHLAEETDFKQRFEREAKLIAALSHPNVVQIFDFDHADRGGQSIYYMIMALIAGPTLRSVMENQHAKGARMPLSEISRVMDSVCSALAYAHKQGITHRDVTPNNILFSDQGGIVLADFGLARLVSGTRLTQSGMTTGTPVYMSPEQCLGLGSDARSDLYSLGVILFEMLSGEAPYGGDSAYAIIMKHINAPIPPLPDTMQSLSSTASAGLSAVVARALAKVPDDRYQTADDFLADFQKAAQGQLIRRTTTAIMPLGRQSAAIPGTVTLPLSTGSLTNAPRRLSPVRQLRPIGLALAAVIVIALVLGALLVRTTMPQSGATPSPSGASSMTDISPFIDDDYTSNPKNEGTTDYKLHWQLAIGDPRVTRQFTKDALQIHSTSPRTATATILDPQFASYSDPYTIEVTMTISAGSQPASGAGIIFRYVSDNQYYVFAVDGMARFSIWERKNGTWTELRNLPNGMQWTTPVPTPGDVSTALGNPILPAGQPNKLTMVVNGNELQAMVNDVQVFKLNNTPSDTVEGGVGIYLATVNADVAHPMAQVDVANFGLNPHATSMTGPPATNTPTSETF